jgi:3D (Asp-Asp-Asp) domain-containing protein
MKTTVEEVLEQNAIVLDSHDYISIPLTDKLLKMKNNEINIRRAIPVFVIADGEKTVLMTTKTTVGDALEEGSITIKPQDRLVGSKVTDSLKPNMELKIIRVTDDKAVQTVKLPFRVIRRVNSSMNEGSEKVIREGKEGQRLKEYKITLEDGKEVARKLIKDAIALAPIDKIIEFGNVLNYKTARGDIIRYSKVINMKATAYTASYAETGKRPGDKGFGITASGMRVRKGVVAVDTRVIPLGTRMYVEVAGKMADYGFSIAADRGSGVNGNKIDVYMDSLIAARNWGVRKVKVYILK